MKKTIFFSIAILSLQTTYSLAAKLTIAVSANAQYAMQEIKKQYEKESGNILELILGSSGKLAAQIKEGAPFDVFLSADMEFPKTLFKEGLAIYPPKVYAYGSLVLWSAKNLEPLTIKTLLLPDLSITIANPKIAPYGEAAVEAMQYFGVYEKVQSKIIYAESISQVSQYISTKNADIGFTAKSVVMSPEMKGIGHWISIDKNSYKPIAQGAILLKSSKERNLRVAEQFYKYLYAEKAQNIFKKFGYSLQQ
jgi:molybdate transport system substrate-binding protein